MFYTNSLWEQGPAFFRRRSPDAGLKYFMIEATVGVPIFHVDLLMKVRVSEEVGWKRYLVASLAVVCDLLADPRVLDCRVASQLFSDDLEGYIVRRISEVLSFEDAEGFTNLVYRCEDGTEYLDGIGLIEGGIAGEMLSLWKSKL